MMLASLRWHPKFTAEHAEGIEEMEAIQQVELFGRRHCASC